MMDRIASNDVDIGKHRGHLSLSSENLSASRNCGVVQFLPGISFVTLERSDIKLVHLVFKRVVENSCDNFCDLRIGLVFVGEHWNMDIRSTKSMASQTDTHRYRIYKRRMPSEGVSTYHWRTVCFACMDVKQWGSVSIHRTVHLQTPDPFCICHTFVLCWSR